MLHKLFKFKGGVKPDTNKTASVNAPIGVAPIPRRLIVPLHQSIGGKPSPLVEPGQYVRKGQRIGGPDQWLSSAVHAPTSGTVLAVEEHISPHPSGLPTLSVLIETDGRDEWIERAPVDYKNLPPERVREIAKGRVWTGVQARQLHLVDQLGGYYDAIDRAKALARTF